MHTKSFKIPVLLSISLVFSLFISFITFWNSYQGPEYFWSLGFNRYLRSLSLILVFILCFLVSLPIMIYISNYLKKANLTGFNRLLFVSLQMITIGNLCASFFSFLP